VLVWQGLRARGREGVEAVSNPSSVTLVSTAASTIEPSASSPILIPSSVSSVVVDILETPGSSSHSHRPPSGIFEKPRMNSGSSP